MIEGANYFSGEEQINPDLLNQNYFSKFRRGSCLPGIYTRSTPEDGSLLIQRDIIVMIL